MNSMTKIIILVAVYMILGGYDYLMILLGM